MNTASLLVELFVEELPPKALRHLGEAFADVLFGQLVAQGLTEPASQHVAYASPRRLAVHVSQVRVQAEDQAVSHKLMPVAVGLTADGQATPALLKKLAALGADASAIATLERVHDGKAEVLHLHSMVRGATLAQGVQKALDDAIARLPIPKVMRYQLQDGWSSVHFVRPAHGLVVLHGADVVEGVSALGLMAGRATHGHRFEARVDPIDLRDADSYAEQLRSEGAVIPGFAARRAEVQRQLAAAAASVGGGVHAIDDAALLDEVTALVERPKVLVCQFEAQFLAVPQECLILTMKANQKYFPLLDAEGKLTHRFLIVSNISPEDASAVIQGNERVVRPRLADAQFFFDQDRKKTLLSRVPQLAKVVYHNQLGTQGERVERVRAIAKAIGTQLFDAMSANNDTLQTPEGEIARDWLLECVDNAAHLAKADLLTDMVGEFPELQGIMGAYYAVNDGLPDEVAHAIEDHYKPRFAGDSLPRETVGVVVALADKLETLVGMFGTGNPPTGDRDPFALRRHALGVIRMLVEKDLPLSLSELLAHTQPAFEANITDISAVLSDFIYERLAGSLREQGYSAQEVDAVLALRPSLLAQVAPRLAAVRAFAALPEAPALAAANKRVTNILKKAGEVRSQVRPELLREAAEKDLYSALQTIAPKADAQFGHGDYTASLQTLAALRAPVDAFFEHVMVNAEEAELRANRLGLLQTLHDAMNRVADLSRLAA
ncbi:MAG: glycine--tRNA ligase subunit beta [Comamonas sp. SCN 65-56]|uniref:glycine--tRNA ligase subunit beta n=1 Tax=Comamonas sp. SCN 65-56 TaxID=1660095 RepID=UPI00086C6C2F|nr:glycine--tRNA ligase subunit beta [Comamonas sp. SCN 65-56]ODS90868.1 MAG: glycine--tRNA ligase subunit beta [Comamonas sp. SCN 65-56]